MTALPIPEYLRVDCSIGGYYNKNKQINKMYSNTLVQRIYIS